MATNPQLVIQEKVHSAAFQDLNKYLQLRRELWTTIRIPAGGTLAVGTYPLFDPTTITSQNWGSGTGNAVLIGTDVPTWYKYTAQATLQKDHYYEAMFMGLSFGHKQALGSTINATLAEDTEKFIYSNAYIQIKPSGKDIDWNVPLWLIGDMIKDNFNDLNSGTGTRNNMIHERVNQFGGKYPLFLKEGAPGLVFGDLDIIDISLVVQEATPAVTGELVIRPTMEGIMYRPS